MLNLVISTLVIATGNDKNYCSADILPAIDLPHEEWERLSLINNR